MNECVRSRQARFLSFSQLSKWDVLHFELKCHGSSILLGFVSIKNIFVRIEFENVGTLHKCS